jgi:hypothetical protein
MRISHISSIAARLIAIVTTMLLLIVTSSAEGQADPRASVVVAIADSLPVGSAKAVIFFNAPPRGQNIVLLPRHNPSHVALGAALRFLDKLQREHPRSPYSAMIPVEGAQAPQNIAPSQRQALHAMIDQVSRRPLTNISGVGLGRWSEFSRTRSTAK